MNPIAQGMALGYSGNQLLNFLTKAIPSLGPRVSQAQKAGHTVESIINFLGKTMEAQSYPKNMTQNQIHGQKTKEKESYTKGLLAKGAALLGTGLATGALSRALPRLATGLIQPGGSPQSPIQPAFPSGISNTPMSPQSPMPSAQSPQQPTPTSPTPIPTQPSTAPVIPAQSSYQNPPVNNSLTQTLTQSPNLPQTQLNTLQVPPLPPALHKNVQGLLQAGNPVEKVTEALHSIQPKIVKEYEKARGQPIARAVEEFAKANHLQEGKPRSVEGNTASSMEGERLKSPKSVILPNGKIGEITNIRQNIATINSEGKEYRRKMEDLVEEPEEAAIQALELIKSFTPEQERSAHHALSMYDEDDKKATFLFHNGEGYVVEDITPEEYERLSKEVDMARTSGKSAIGAWASGTGSRGAAYQNVVKDLKKPYRKIKVGYNLFKNFQKNILSAQKKKKKNEKA